VFAIDCLLAGRLTNTTFEIKQNNQSITFISGKANIKEKEMKVQ